MTRVIVVDDVSPDPESISIAAAVIRGGGLVAFPTETVYGLGVDALSSAAVRRVFAAKDRPATDPLIVHVLDVAALDRVSDDVPGVARELAEAFWPGPLTVVVPRGSAVPLEVTAGLDSVAVRSPDHPVAHALIAAVGRPIAAPSANPFGRTSPTTAAHVVSDLGDRVDLVLDGGPTTVGIESTVVECRTDPPVVLRPGGVTIEALAPWAARLRTAPAGSERGPQASPGTLSKHYAPRARLVLLQGPDGDIREAMIAAVDALDVRGHRVGLLVANDDLSFLATANHNAHVEAVGWLDDPTDVAKRLYASVRALDACVDVIVARDIGASGLLLSVRDRLVRAAHGRVVVVADGDVQGSVAAVVEALS